MTQEEEKRTFEISEELKEYNYKTENDIETTIEEELKAAKLFKESEQMTTGYTESSFDSIIETLTAKLNLKDVY